MDSVPYLPRVLLVSQDLQIRKKINATIDEYHELILAGDADEAITHLEADPISVLIIDAEASSIQKEAYEHREVVCALELIQYASQMNTNLPIIVLVNSLLSKAGSFAARCGATLIMDRRDINQNRLLFAMRVLRKRSFRTVLSRDLETGRSYPVDLYHYLPMNKRYLPFLEAGQVLTQEKMALIQSSETRHLYVRETELKDLLLSMRKDHELTFTEQLSSIHAGYRKLLIDFFNISTDSALYFGKAIVEDGMSLVDKIRKLICSYPDAHTCLEELPYPRWSILAHGINSAIYGLVFSDALELEDSREFAFAALIHNIGLSEIDQRVVMKKESDLNYDELAEYKKHVAKSLEIIKRKRIVLNPMVEDIIFRHHEHYDGTGFPLGLAGEQISKGGALLSIVGAFDHIHSIHFGEKPKSIREVWNLLKDYSRQSSANQKFHPVLLKKLDRFFKETAVSNCHRK